PEGAAAALCSPNRVARSLGWIELHAFGEKAEPALLGLFKNENPRLRARALGVLSQIKGREVQHLAAGLNDADSDVRCFAIRLCRVRASKSPEYLAKILADESISANEKPRFLRAFDFLPATPEKEKALVKLATLGAKSGEVSREALVRLKGNTSPAIAKALDD